MALPAADLSRLSPSISAADPKIYLNTNQQALATGICGDLARWALERNCVLGDLNDFGQISSHHHESLLRLMSGGGELHPHPAINVTSLAATAAATAQRQQQQYLETLGGELHAGAGTKTSPLSALVVDHLLEPMHQLEGKVNYYFSDIWLSSGDQRTNKLPLIGAGPWKLLYATLIYLYLIKWLLPRLMRPLKPLELNWPIRLYNLFMVISNMWAFYHGARILNFGTKCFGCETINHEDNSAEAIELLHYGWLFFVSRLVEWLDTIFFVLRKKERQVTKLHVFHHSFVPLISWTYLKYHPGYTVAFFPFVNTLVHSIMYTYYLLATFGPGIQPYLWWKRYLTSLQIVQFVLIIIQLASIPLTGDRSCQYPRGFLAAAFAGAILFLWLFYTYYRETYSRKSKTRSPVASSAAAANSGRSPMEPVAERGLGDECGQCRQRPAREGSSRSLEDSIDNAICCDEPLHDHRQSNGAGQWKLKLG